MFCNFTNIGQHQEQDDQQDHPAGDDLGGDEEGEPRESNHQLGWNVELGEGWQELSLKFYFEPLD